MGAADMEDAAFGQWIDDAKAANFLEVASALGARLKRAGHDHSGPCPACGGDDRFSINTQKNVWLCRGSEAAGSVIDMVMHVNGCDFIGACEFINQTPPPRGESRPVDMDYVRQKRDQRREDEMERAEQGARDLQKAMSNSEKLWAHGVPIKGTYAEEYLRRRGINLADEQTDNLRFVRDLKFFGNASKDEDEVTCLGTFPCMIGAMRNADMNIIAIHRTYLDPEVPRRLNPPAGTWNKTKKVSGPGGGCGIWLGPIAEVVAISEGIETGLSWQALSRVKEPGMSIVAAYSLGNMAAIHLPPQVRAIHLIGDGDSDPLKTKQALLAAQLRFEKQGFVVDTIDIAPKGSDWNDILVQQRAEVAA
jgi:hypothetical protein